jgi:methionyl-tRNA formyltransferase
MPKSPIKVALFGSYYRGLCVLEELLKVQAEGIVKVVGVATDNPDKTFVSPHKRLWQYPHTQNEKTMVADLARAGNLPVYSERIKTFKFYDIFENQWKPDICYMATFGQLVDNRLFKYPRFGFYNLHPSGDKSWPSYVGGNPFQMMLNNGDDYCVISLHEVDEKFDNGKLINTTERIYFPRDISVPELHKLTSPKAGILVSEHLKKVLKSI